MSTQHHQNRIRRSFDDPGGQTSLLSQCCMSTERAIRESPLLATLVAFGAGLGCGAVIGGLLADPSESRRRTTEALGRRVLDSLAESLPGSIRQHLGV